MVLLLHSRDLNVWPQNGFDLEPTTDEAVAIPAKKQEAVPVVLCNVQERVSTGYPPYWSELWQPQPAAEWSCVSCSSCLRLRSWTAPRTGLGHKANCLQINSGLGAPNTHLSG
ncbi:hypothetical protein L7F22_060170 [Adiantum nelumboides]|nr:hypothetical protein [Adiantum nelumboides]